MARVYNVSGSALVSTLVDFIEINAPSDACVILRGFAVTQYTDAGDAQSEQLNVRIHRGSTSGSAGSASTPVPLNSGDAAFGGTVEMFNTTQSTLGDTVFTESFNVMSGLSVLFQPDDRPVISPSGRLVISLASAPADEIGFNIRAVFEELGG